MSDPDSEVLGCRAPLAVEALANHETSSLVGSIFEFELKLTAAEAPALRVASQCFPLHSPHSFHLSTTSIMVGALDVRNQRADVVKM